MEENKEEKEGILFENKTIYNKENYKLFLQVHEAEFAMSEYAYFFFNLIFFGLCMFFAFSYNEIILGIILLIGLLIYLWYKIIFMRKKAKRDQESEKLSGKFINTYKFYKRYFTVENSEGNATLLYFKLYRIVETNENYYIYISRENAFIVSKQGFTKGEESEFRKFIISKAITKYKNRMKKSRAK